MPWATPTLRDVRSTVRDAVRGRLPGADASIPNSVLRVMSDTQGLLAHLNLQYIDWLALQLLPDTAEEEFLERHGNIWLTNADGTRGRKAATFAKGSANFTGVDGTILPQFTRLVGGNLIEYETTEQITIGTIATPANIVALDPGVVGNLDAGASLGMVTTIPNVDSAVTVVLLDGGTDQESIDNLRARILLRIQEPPMGGDKTDYIQWTLAYPGVTRAWSYPLEMGIGTVTVRFMMDELRVTDGGFPSPDDCAAVELYLNTVRPVAVKDFFVEAPIPFLLDLQITNLERDDEATRAAIEASITAMLFERVFPGQTVYHSWVSEAISSAIGEDHHDLTFENAVMPSPGYMGVLGTVTYG